MAPAAVSLVPRHAGRGHQPDPDQDGAQDPRPRDGGTAAAVVPAGPGGGGARPADAGGIRAGEIKISLQSGRSSGKLHRMRGADGPAPANSNSWTNFYSRKYRI